MSLAFADFVHVVVKPIDHPVEQWTRVHRWVDQALAHEHSLIDASDVFDRVIQKRMKLWGIYEYGSLSGAMVTQMESGSRGRALNVVALGGEGMDHWLESLLERLTQYARENECRYIFEMGRRGWLRVLDKHGWVDGPATMIKVI
jgi:hypothetical protein